MLDVIVDHPPVYVGKEGLAPSRFEEAMVGRGRVCIRARLHQRLRELEASEAGYSLYVVLDILRFLWKKKWWPSGITH